MNLNNLDVDKILGPISFAVNKCTARDTAHGIWVNVCKQVLRCRMSSVNHMEAQLKYYFVSMHSVKI